MARQTKRAAIGELVQWLCSVKHRHPCAFWGNEPSDAATASLTVLRDPDATIPEQRKASAWELTPAGEAAYLDWLRKHYAPGRHPDLPKAAQP